MLLYIAQDRKGRKILRNQEGALVEKLEFCVHLQGAGSAESLFNVMKFSYYSINWSHFKISKTRPNINHFCNAVKVPTIMSFRHFPSDISPRSQLLKDCNNVCINQ